MAYYATFNATTAAGWTTPDASALDLADHHDIRALITPSLWNPASAQAILAKWNPTGNQRSYFFALANLGSTGALTFQFSTTGSNNVTITSPAFPVGLTSQTTAWVRVVFTSNTGGLSQCQFYYSTDGSAWTVIGGAQTNATPGPVFNSTSLLYVGTHATGTPLSGRIYRAQLWDASGPTKVAEFDVRRQATAAAFTSVTGEVWTPGGSGVIGVDEFLSAADFGPASIPVGALSGTGLADGLVVQAFNGLITARRAVPYYRALDYGVKQDVVHLTDGAATGGSTLISSSGSHLGTAITTGMNVLLVGAGAAGANFATTVTGISNLPHSIDVADTIGTTVSSKGLWVGTDDSVAMNALLATLPLSSASPQAGVGGTIVLESGRIMGLASVVSLDGLFCIRIEGQGGVSATEGGAFGTSVVTMTPGMTAFRSYSSSGASQNGPQFIDFSIDDVAGGSTLIDTKATNRVVLENMSLRNALIGFKTDANALDSAWHLLKQVHFYNCTTGWYAPDCFGGEMIGGMFTGCAIGFDGVKDRHVGFYGVDFEVFAANAIGIRSRGYGMRGSNLKIETSNLANAMTGIDIDGFASGTSPPWGAYHRFTGIALFGGNGSTQYGIKLGTLAKGGYYQAVAAAIPVANRFSDSGTYNDAWISSYDASLSVRQHAGIPEYVGTGSPEGVIAAPIGATYRRSDAATVSQFYMKSDGTGTTGWKKLR